MDYDFYQSKFFAKRYFKITNDGLQVHYKSLGKRHDAYLKFEDIGTKIVYFTSGKRIWLVASVLLILLSIFLYIVRINGEDVEPHAELFYVSLAMPCLACYIITFQKSCFLSKPNNIHTVDFFLDKPTKLELTNFIEALLSRRKTYLLTRYGQLNKNLGYEFQHHNLRWLLDNDVLSHVDYTEKVMELDQLFFVKNITGFSFSPN
ncbi:MAG: hypothetical protein EOO20_17890 [Chryseobacterium sp.]|nr:MAG: hypothetical protein EOO20_17890 [Chryseobacterium sp.]